MRRKTEEDRFIVIVTAREREARMLVRLMRGAVRRHFGLFSGWEAALGEYACRVAVCGPGEQSAYAAVRQLASLYPPALVLYFSGSTAVAESYRAGDLVLVSSARPIYVPAAVTENACADLELSSDFTSRTPDRFAFPSHELRSQVLGVPAVEASPELLKRAMSAANPIMIPCSVQAAVEATPAGTGAVQNWSGRTAEYIRRRYHVDVVDTGSLGALSAAGDASLSCLAALLVQAGRSGEVARDYHRHEPRYLEAAARLLHQILLRTVQSEEEVPGRSRAPARKARPADFKP